MLRTLVYAVLTFMIVPTDTFAATPRTGGFTDLDARGRAGKRLNVVFFGCSLTWGANASNQELTSYRAHIADALAERYPAAPIRCYDAAIGGTNSVLGVFRLDRDVLSHDPDLVFVDFTANDDIASPDPHTLASYEAILRRLASLGIPVVQVAFPFRWDIDRQRLPKLVRLQAHRQLATDYGNGWGDAVQHVLTTIESGQETLDSIWVTDGVHPHDVGYQLFAEAAWNGFIEAVAAGSAPLLPDHPRYGSTFTTVKRVHLANLSNLSQGWDIGEPSNTSLYHDFLMSRWLDRLIIARNQSVDQKGKPQGAMRSVSPLRVRVSASTIALLGEATTQSGTFRVRIDGTPVTGLKAQITNTDQFDGNKWKTGNGHLFVEIARDLNPEEEHLLEIEPTFPQDSFGELRLESICVSGPQANVSVLAVDP